MPNSFAHLMLFAWPLVTVFIFSRLPVPKAAVVSIVGGYLLLPTKLTFNLPLLPPYEREIAAALPALIMVLVKSRPAPAFRRGGDPDPALAHVLPGWLPSELFTKLCVIVALTSPFLTSITNSDALNDGRYIPGLGPYDGASSVMMAAITLIPFLIARKYLAHPREHAMLLVLLCFAGLAYSLPALYEVRMSPQLNNIFYGFFPHDWRQHIRGGGFRPVVFLEHGLRLAVFFAVCLLATLGASRTERPDRRGLFLVAAVWLLGTLVLSKSLGALLISALFAPLILLAGVRLQLVMAAAVALTVLIYPMTRSTGLFPMDTVLSTVSKVAPEERIRSLGYRIRMEDTLLEHANERPLFGWGGWGRNRVWDERGRDTTTTDGTWIIIFGRDGWVGYLATFGLLTIPTVLLTFRRRKDLTVASSALSLALVANLVDLIPNSGLTPLTWLMAGAVAGRLELRRIEEPEPETEARQPVQTSPYRRNFPPEGAPARTGRVLRRPQPTQPVRRTRVEGRRR